MNIHCSIVNEERPDLNYIWTNLGLYILWGNRFDDSIKIFNWTRKDKKYNANIPTRG